MDKEYNRIIRKRIRTALIIVIFAVLLFVILFNYFKITHNGRTAFKEAKNVKLALSMLDIEYYSKGKCVYEPDKKHGLSKESIERIRGILENKGTVDIISYDYDLKIVTGFTYQIGNYKVTYRYEDGEDNWDVDYFINLYDY
ncbi:MAG: hypothetical protein IJT72_06790 [Lachnospiraceae bacterium]|nr:hypothetical protein [Lachnospiraceae bacterium]